MTPLAALGLVIVETLGPACADAIAQNPALITDPNELRALSPHSALTPLAALIVLILAIIIWMCQRMSVLTPLSALKHKLAFGDAWRASCGHAWALFSANVFWFMVGAVMFLVGLAVAGGLMAVLTFVGGMAGGVLGDVLIGLGRVIAGLYVLYALIVGLGARASFGGALVAALHEAECRYGGCHMDLDEDHGGEAFSNPAQA